MEAKLLVSLGVVLRTAAEQLPKARNRSTYHLPPITTSTLRGQHEPDGADEALPRCDFVAERAPSRGSEAVILGAPAVLGHAPVRVDPAALLEPDEGRVDGALADLQRLVR